MYTVVFSSNTDVKYDIIMQALWTSKMALAVNRWADGAAMVRQMKQISTTVQSGPNTTFSLGTSGAIMSLTGPERDLLLEIIEQPGWAIRQLDDVLTTTQYLRSLPDA